MLGKSAQKIRYSVLDQKISGSFYKKEFIMFNRLTNSIFLTLISLLLFGTIVYARDFSRIPEKGKVTMVDLGAKKCIPCKMMAPIIEALQEEYKGRAVVTFIDVWEKPEEAKKFSIRTIPTQIFYDTEGKEVRRHEGFIDKKSIVAMFDKLGVK